MELREIGGAIIAGPFPLYAVIKLAELIWQELGPGGHQTLRDRSLEESWRGLTGSGQVHVNG